jgi:putative membrane protein
MPESPQPVLLIVLILVLVLIVLPLLWGSVMMGGMGGMMGWGWGPAGNPWWSILSLLFWLLVLAGLALLVASAFRQVQPGVDRTAASRALEILKERYARGEITREQYEQMRRDLT